MLLPSFYTMIAGKRIGLEATDTVAAGREASRRWCEFRDETGEGVSTIGNGCRVYREEPDGPEYVAAVSYNGRVWVAEPEPVPHVCNSITTADGHGAYCGFCGEVLA